MLNTNSTVNNDVGVKTCQLNLRVYNALYLCISAPLYEARCSKNSDIGFLYVRQRSRHECKYAIEYGAQAAGVYQPLTHSLLIYFIN